MQNKNAALHRNFLDKALPVIVEQMKPCFVQVDPRRTTEITCRIIAAHHVKGESNTLTTKQFLCRSTSLVSGCVAKFEDGGCWLLRLAVLHGRRFAALNLEWSTVRKKHKTIIFIILYNDYNTMIMTQK